MKAMGRSHLCRHTRQEGSGGIKESVKKTGTKYSKPMAVLIYGWQNHECSQFSSMYILRTDSLIRKTLFKNKETYSYNFT